MSNYSQVLDAIEAYYGRNDIWRAMYEYGGDAATAQELAKAVSQVPGVRTVRTVSGKIQYFEYIGDEYSPHVISDMLANNVNSNVNVSTTGGMGSAPAAGGGGTATKVKTPVQMDTAGGAVTGMKTGVMQAGKFTVNDVLYPIAAVASGITLGKWIDSTLYDLNPDFWDAQGLSNLNPETWGDITSGSDDLNSRVFNMIFGIEEDKTQPYLSEQALAYMAAYMASQGVFNTGSVEYDTTIDNINVTAYPDSFSPRTFYPTQNVYLNQGYLYKDSDNLKIIIAQSPGSSTRAIIVASTLAGQTLWVTPHEQIGGSNYIKLATSLTFTYNGQTVYWNYAADGAAWDFENTIGISPYPFPQWNENANKYLAWASIYGTMSGGETIEGISTQDGATVFDPSEISDFTDIPSVLNALKEQFPDLWSNAITNTVIDPETGEEVTTTYVPTGFPQIDPENLTQPIGNISTQDDTAYDPSENPDISEQIAQLISFITDTSGNTPTMQPDDVTNPNPPETGSGNTPIVTPPAGSATALWSIYNPTQAQINAFGAWLWSNDFVDQLKKIFNDPMESIISLHKVFGTPKTGGTQNIAVGYLNSGVSSKIVTAQYTDVDCGSVQLSEYFGNVYDYKDTSVELYLPFIGIVPLSVSDVMRASIHVVYHIDVLTGACLADVEVVRDAGAGGVLYQYSGDCAVHYPVSSGSYIGIVGGILSAGAGIAGTIASGGAAAPLVLGGASALMRMHTDVARSGGFSANAGAMGAKVPYLIISRPQTALPENYLDIEGIGSNKTVTLNTCTGYTRIKEVYLQGVGDATEGELSELETLLKAGVIFPINETPPND